MTIKEAIKIAKQHEDKSVKSRGQLSDEAVITKSNKMVFYCKGGVEAFDDAPLAFAVNLQDGSIEDPFADDVNGKKFDIKASLQELYGPDYGHDYKLEALKEEERYYMDLLNSGEVPENRKVRLQKTIDYIRQEIKERQ